MELLSHLIYFVTITCFVLAVKAASYDEELENEVKNDTRGWLSLCNCSKPALQRMQSVLAEYSSGLSSSDPPSLDKAIERIKTIAHDCTKLPECRCPEGYFKTKDGYNCLKISAEEMDCNEAMNICSQDKNARLAVAKDKKHLTKLADYIREVDPNDEDFYWIGLSYNHINDGVPVWTWEDGSAASYDITRKLKNNYKKNLLQIIDINDAPGQAIERVAISKDYQGARWKQETCSTSQRGSQIAKHKYICEFVMFKVEIKAVTSGSTSSTKTAGKNIAPAGISKE
ncbi:uncharacterized protein LOC143449788 isoform X2 [Clavelina lepadiformis]